jgi:DNA-binding transcriptional LysR family regulator
MALRHLRYFTAIVQWKGYREASRRLHAAQPAISQTVSDLERELELKLFSRAKRAAKGEIGKLSIGFLGSSKGS